MIHWQKKQSFLNGNEQQSFLIPVATSTIFSESKNLLGEKNSLHFSLPTNILAGPAGLKSCQNKTNCADTKRSATI